MTDWKMTDNTDWIAYMRQLEQDKQIAMLRTILNEHALVVAKLREDVIRLTAQLERLNQPDALFTKLADMTK